MLGLGILVKRERNHEYHQWNLNQFLRIELRVIKLYSQFSFGSMSLNFTPQYMYMNDPVHPGLLKLVFNFVWIHSGPQICASMVQIHVLYLTGFFLFTHKPCSLQTLFLNPNSASNVYNPFTAHVLYQTVQFRCVQVFDQPGDQGCN